MKTAGILIVGDEVLSGEVRDENGPYLLERLAAVGSRVVRVAIVGDRQEEIVHELRLLRGAADAVLVSGGIGPTHDDVTRPAVAAALGVPLERHPAAVERVRHWYGDKTTEAELSMALLPRGSRVLRGAKTGTLGFSAGGIYVMPGVPFLLRDVFEGCASEFAGEGLHREEVVTTLREGEIAPDLTLIQGRALDVAIGSYPVMDAAGRWTTRIVVRSTDAARSAEVAGEVRTAFARLARPSGPPRHEP